MIEMCVSKKNKINLDDYNHQADIANRVLMSHFTPQDVEVLEEILYGSIRIPLVKLKKNLDLPEPELLSILEKLQATKLFKIETDSIVVDKEKRKYYDYQILKFDEDFKSNMNYIQGILKKLPIQILPIWYAIPRSSNNIFASMIERYFKTPYIYERYLMELNLTDSIMAGIVSDLFESENFELDALAVQKKYALDRDTFEEMMLHFEFNFVCCTKYVLEGDQYREVITPFQEWADYLKFRKKHQPKMIERTQEVSEKESQAFHFVQDMTYLLEEIVHQPLSLLSNATDSDFIFDEEAASGLIAGLDKDSSRSKMDWQVYLSRLASRLVRIGLAIRHDEMLCPHHSAPHWLNMEIEDKALYLYRHPSNRTLSMGFDPSLDTEKNVKEVEKSLERIPQVGWYDLQDFLQGVTCAIGENGVVELAKEGPEWTYRLPRYQEEEIQFMHYVIMQRLYEVGMVSVGSYQDRDCFKLLSFGMETLC